MAVAPTSSNDFSTISAMFLGVWVAHWEPSKHKDLRTSVLQFGAKTTKTRQLRNTVSTLRKKKKKTVAAAMIFDALEPGLWLAPNGLTREWWMPMWGKNTTIIIRVIMAGKLNSSLKHVGVCLKRCYPIPSTGSSWCSFRKIGAIGALPIFRHFRHFRHRAARVSRPGRWWLFAPGVSQVPRMEAPRNEWFTGENPLKRMI